MVESAFLETMRQFLAGASELVPSPASIGIVEPVEDADLPAVVLSLEQVQCPGNGLGERTALITGGALEWGCEIDLENPMLPTDPTFSLLSPDRKVLTLWHGGLVRKDGTTGLLTGEDISVTVAGVAREVVAGPPDTNQVSVEPQIGRLTFGSALPATGVVKAQYRLGQWEQRGKRMTGVLSLAVSAKSAEQVRTLSEGLATALDRAQPDIPGLHSNGIIGLSSIGRPDPAAAGARVRTIRFDFEFELEINRPESSGGIIQRVPVSATVA